MKTFRMGFLRNVQDSPVVSDDAFFNACKIEEERYNAGLYIEFPFPESTPISLVRAVFVGHLLDNGFGEVSENDAIRISRIDG